MGFLKRFFDKVFQETGTTASAGSFDHLSNDEIEAHMGVKKYDNFTLTDAVRPAYDLKVVPEQGYRHDVYRDAESGTTVPVLMIAVSAEKVFDVFLDLLDPLGTEVDVVIETSHERSGSGHVDLYREYIDMPVLKSTLWDFEEMLSNDGCTGIAVLNSRVPREIQFDEHKILIVYGSDLKDFEEVLEYHGIECNESIRFITEAEHVHSSCDRFAQRFDELKMRLGMDSMVV